MKNLSLYIDAFTGIHEKTEKLRFFLILMLVFSLPFDLFYSSVILIGLFTTTLIDLNKEKIRRIPRQVWIFQLVYLLSIAGYFYSSHKNVAGFLLERQLSIFLLPIVLPIAVEIDQRKLELLLRTLALSCFVTLAYLFAHMVYAIHWNLKLPLLHTALSGAFFNHQFSRPVGIHAGYLSLYVALSIFYLVQVYTRISGSFGLRSVLIGALGVLFLGLFFLASRNTVIGTFFILIFISPLYNSKNKLRYISVSLLCFMSGFLLIKNTPYLHDRFSVELITDIKPRKNGAVNLNSAEPRYERWKGAYALIKRSPLIGYGTGDEIEMLRTEYVKRDLFISYIERFNAHNQYLSYLIKNGVLGLCVFLFAFGYFFYLAMRSRNFMYMSFLILLVIGFYTENILDANKGIIFFALFNTFFGYAALKHSQKKAEETAS